MFIALDLSTKSTGVAVYEEKENKLVYYDCLTANNSNVIDRIEKIASEIALILLRFPTIDKIVLEEVRPENNLSNIHTHRVLMWLQAAIAFTAHKINPKIKLEYIYPSEWRKSCGIKTGRGVKREVLKQEDINFVKNTFNIIVNDDIADAIGIGYHYLVKNQSAF